MTVNERIEAWFAGREDEYVSALAPLIAIDSTTGTPEPGKPFGPGPAMALDAALELARKWGLTTGEDEGYVGTVDLNGQPDQLHILAHLDVVGIGDGWDTDPFTLVRDGDLIYGRGTDDDKGPRRGRDDGHALREGTGAAPEQERQAGAGHRRGDRLPGHRALLRQPPLCPPTPSRRTPISP